MGTVGGWLSQLPARLRVKAGIQSVTLQGTESGIRKLDADFTRGAKTRATPRISPGVSEMVWEEEKHGNMHCQGWCICRDAPSCCRKQPVHSKGTQAMKSLAQHRQNMSNSIPSSLLLALLVE